MSPLTRWRRGAEINRLLYGSTPSAIITNPVRVLILLAVLGIGLEAGIDYGRKLQRRLDVRDCVEGAAIERGR